MSLIKNLPKTVIPKVCDFLINWEIPKQSRIIIGFSGGPDSLALLLSLYFLRNDWSFALSCVYVDHGMRNKREIQKEIDFITKTTQALGVEADFYHIPAGKLVKAAKTEKRSLEDVAREARYKILFSVLAQKKYDYIALGHTFDDQIETQIMRFFQGSGLKGLAGMPAKRGKIIRPLLFCARKEIIAYLREQHKKYMLDSSNKKMRFLRNKVRHKLIPVINAVFPGFKKALLNISKKNIYAHEFIRDQALKLLVWEKTDLGFCIPESIFLKAPPIIRLYSLYDTILGLEKKGPFLKKKRLSFAFLLPLLMVKNRNSPEIPLHGYKIVVYWKKESLFLERDVVVPIKKGYFIDVKFDDIYDIGGEEKKWRISFTENPSNKTEFSLLITKLSFPLALRSRNEGDKIDFGWGYKRIKKLFNEWKVPLYVRKAIPILEDKQGIVGIIGKPFGFKNCFRKDVVTRDNLCENVLYCSIQPVELKGEYE